MTMNTTDESTTMTTSNTIRDSSGNTITTSDEPFTVEEVKDAAEEAGIHGKFHPVDTNGNELDTPDFEDGGYDGDITVREYNESA